ncbi:Atg26p [Sugiyamaella lignohabitans]|uniref:Sterol 3-beta-glucosyltransferase n=1 Tax=Sugiyamaella lignohabitans TaxID=796027 RepID=A0A167FDW8_9ASCO|nr:Atg26p [Sugiyamaella lignohabitans]ANB15176.1 Atg26p [Sugiyamaella lignohabitans]
MPRNQTDSIKSGSLRKKSRKTPSFSKFWFVLRSDSFSYYTNATEMYFPAGTIDLRYAVKAEIVHHGLEKEQLKSSTFSIITETRTYTFKADSAKAAHEWVKALQKEIFRSRNEGDYVKIIIPLVNIIDLEDSPIMNIATTLKIRAIENDETYAVDEYVLAFFTKGKEVVDAIKVSMKELGVSGIAVDDSSSTDLAAKAGSLNLEEIRENRPKLLKTQTSLKVKSPMVAAAASNVASTPKSPVDSLKKTNSSVSLSKKVRNLFNDNEGSTTPGSPHLSPRIGPLKSTSSKEVIKDWTLDSPSGLESPPGESMPSRQKSRPGTPPDQLAVSAAMAALQSDRDRKSHEQEEVYPTGHTTGHIRISSSIGQIFKKEGGSGSGASTPGEDNKSYDFLSASESNQIQYESSDKKKKKSANIVHKVTDMWGGGRKHFRDPNQAGGFRDDRHLVSEEDGAESNERFRAHFSLGETDNLVATYFCHIQKAIPIYGKMYLSNEHLCFRSLLPGTNTKMILPLHVVENVTKEKGFRFGYSGLVIVVHGHEEIFFEFGSSNNRDDCEIMILREMDRSKNRSIIRQSGSDYALRSARLITYEDALRNELPPGINVPPVILEPCNDTSNDFFVGKAKDSLRFTLLTIGSRGDVQPYISLGKGLLKEGHKVKIATHAEFKPWIEKHGIEFAEVAGDPGALMKIMIEHGMFSVSFLREAAAKFRDWIDELLLTAWKACQDTDVLIESPSAMAGIHIAEALKIPYMRAFTMPWTRTRAYPHAFIVPEQKMGGSYNYLTYVMFDNVFWKGISGQVNRWRKKTLHLPRTNLDLLQQTQVPFMYNVSPSVLVPPVDFPSWIRVTGYWFLDEGGEDYVPDKSLVDFIAKARKDDAKLVYIGFGSIVVSNPKELTKAVVASVQKAGVRCILSKGWSDRLGKGDASVPEVELPPEIYQIKSAPHDWLFPQVDAAVHHGGSGTTGASLRAGLPTIIKPFFGDQFFYAGRVEDLGAGVHLRKLTVNQFSKALWEVTHNERIISKAADIGKRIREENGVDTAIQVIYQELEYARSLIKDGNVPVGRKIPTLMDVAGLPVKLVQRATAPLPSLPICHDDSDQEHDEERDKKSNSSQEDDSTHTDGSWTVVDTESKEQE